MIMGITIRRTDRAITVLTTSPAIGIDRRRTAGTVTIAGRATGARAAAFWSGRSGSAP